MKAMVNYPYKDKNTGEKHFEHDTVEVTEERFEEINKGGKFLTPLEELGFAGGFGATFITFTTNDLATFEVSHTFGEVKTLIDSGAQVVGKIEIPTMGFKILVPNVFLFGDMHIAFTGYAVAGDGSVNGTTEALMPPELYRVAINNKNEVLTKA